MQSLNTGKPCASIQVLRMRVSISSFFKPSRVKQSNPYNEKQLGS